MISLELRIVLFVACVIITVTFRFSCIECNAWPIIAITKVVFPSEISYCESRISNVKEDPCYGDKGSACACSAERRNMSYLIQNTNSSALSMDQLEHQVVYAYIHINKAGGQSIKSALFKAISESKWSAAAYGTKQLWNNSGEYRELVEYMRNSRHLREASYFHCGKVAKHLQRKCALRATWGTLSLGLCDLFPGKPCLYFLNLRDPVQRAFSEYNYFCVHGAENRKKWLPDWHKQGFCPLTVVEYLQLYPEVCSILTNRLSRGCGTQCALKAAKLNLNNTCVRYFFLHSLSSDVAQFAGLVGGTLGTALANVASGHVVKNSSPRNERTELQRRDPQVVKRVKELVHLDIELFNYAIKIHPAKLLQPLTSCN